MDIAVDLVEVYLRTNGYLTLSEWQVQTFNDREQWETLTDIDIFALRLPGPTYAAFAAPGMTPEDLAVHDPGLFLEPDTADVIIGEVKEGEAHFNPAINREETLETALQRVQWLYNAPSFCRHPPVPSLGGMGKETRVTSKRADLYNALEKAIGREPTRLLMERIDPIDGVATKSDLEDLRQSLVGQIADLRNDMNVGFAKIDQQFVKVDDRLFQFHETLRGYSRTFVTTQAASIVGAVGLAVALIKLF